MNTTPEVEEIVEGINGYRLVEKDETLKVFKGEIILPLTELTTLQQKHAEELEKVREEERERITTAITNYTTNSPTSYEKVKKEVASDILFVVENYVVPTKTDKQ